MESIYAKTFCSECCRTEIGSVGAMCGGDETVSGVVSELQERTFPQQDRTLGLDNNIPWLVTPARSHIPFPSLNSMERASSNEESPGVSKKRKIPSSSSWLPHKGDFQRKRSATACQLCRSRKTKCDNNRPICSKCHELGAECIYQDQAAVEPYVNVYVGTTDATH